MAATAAPGCSIRIGVLQLLVLDLTPKTSSSTLRVDEVAWLATHRPRGTTTDRLVLAGIVTGNRLTPSAYSR